MSEDESSRPVSEVVKAVRSVANSSSNARGDATDRRDCSVRSISARALDISTFLALISRASAPTRSSTLLFTRSSLLTALL
jgi:hypothetical protein